MPRTQFRILTLILVLAALGFRAQPPPSPRTIRVVVEEQGETSAEMVELGGGDYLPMKTVARFYGAVSHWYPVSGKVVLELNRRTVTLRPGRAVAEVGKRAVKLRHRVRYTDRRVLIPLDLLLNPAFAEASGRVARWGARAGRLTILPRATVLSPRHYSSRATTRVVFPLVGEGAFGARAADHAVTVVFPGGRADSLGRVDTVEDEVVRDVGFVRGDGAVIATVRLGRFAGPFHLSRHADPPMVILDVARTGGAAPSIPVVAKTSGPAGGPLPVPQGEGNAEGSVGAEQLGGGVRRVVVDPGHGGEDTGAIGQNGTREKDTNLMIAGELARVLRREHGVEVILTRKDDSFIPLAERTRIANERRADLFVSIHGNASLTQDKNGFEVYVLSEKASDAAAEAVAAMENSVLELETPGRLKGKLASVLYAMTLNEHMNEASELASLIADEVERRADVPNRGVKRAGFFVLKGAQMPAVLVETAYLSNHREEARLNTRQFRSRMADAIYNGIIRFEERTVAKLP